MTTAVFSLVLIAGCNGAESASNGGTSRNGAGTYEELRASMKLSPDAISVHDVMEELETLWYDTFWPAMDEDRIADATRALIRTSHLLSVAKPPKEVADDPKFSRWLADTSAAVNDAGRVAFTGNMAKLRPMAETLDRKRCVACHKLYKPKDD